MAGGKKWEGKEKGGKEERREEGHTLGTPGTHSGGLTVRDRVVA